MAQQYIKGVCIGKGSFGEVYRAFDTTHRRDVALKLVDLEQADEEIDVSNSWFVCHAIFARSTRPLFGL
jgi:serine/threonine protein kinase